MKQNKLLYITPYLPFPNNKAANLFISKRIELLSKEFQIDLLSITNGNYDTNITKYKISKYIDNFDFIVREKVNILSIFQAFSKNEMLFNTLSYEVINKIKNIIGNKDYRYIVIEHSYLASFIINNISKISSKTIVVFHNIETDYFRDLFQKTSIFNPRKYFHYIEYNGCMELENKLFTKNIKAFWFLSEQDLEYVENRTKNKNLLLSTTINFNLKNHYNIEKKYDLLYMGQLDNERNLHGLKWFMKDVYPDISYLSFAIAGRGNISNIKKITKNYNNIDLIGEVENLDDIFSKSKITVLPIFNTIGVQTKLFDALSQGNIMVCSKDAIRGTPFKDTEHLVVASDENEFKSKILEAIDNLNDFKYIHINLEKFQKDFNEDKFLLDMKRSLDEK